MSQLDPSYIPVDHGWQRPFSTFDTRPESLPITDFLVLARDIGCHWMALVGAEHLVSDHRLWCPEDT